MMDLETAEFLLSPEGDKLLETARSLQGSFLIRLTRLRKEYPAPIASDALELLELRERARKKFSRADRMFFTREALEQSSSETISRYRAKRFRADSRVLDLGCGIGGDTIGLATRCFVTAVDRDPVRLALARRNVEVYGLSDRVEFICADITEMPLDADAAFIDPSRRSEGRRARSPAYIEPSADFLHRLAASIPDTAIKLSPAFSDEELESFGGEIEFISENGECKEALIWLRSAGVPTGPGLACGDTCAPTDAPTGPSRRATVLPQEATMVYHPGSADVPIGSGVTCGDTCAPTDVFGRADVPVGSPGEYVYEPDPCVIRAHLIVQLARDIGAWKLDEQIAYLTSDAPVTTPFADAYRVIEHLPFNLKKLNARLASLHAGKVIVKKRGVPYEPDEIERRLKTPGDREIILILTRVSGKPWALICTPSL